MSEFRRKMGFTEQNLCSRWKKLQGMGTAEVQGGCGYRGRTANLRQLMAALSPDKQMLQDVLQESLKPDQPRPRGECLYVPNGASARPARC